MVSYMHSRKKRLVKYVETGTILHDDSICYHRSDGKGDIQAGIHYICGLWFESYRFCPEIGTCCFLTTDGKTKMKGIHCHHSWQKVRAHFLTYDKLYQLIGKDLYETQW